MKKKCQVVMLPTEEKVLNSGIYKYSEMSTGYEQSSWWNELRIAKSGEQMGAFYWKSKKPQHLYFLSDDEIKEGDWCYDIVNKIIKQFERGDFPNSYLKIIATTGALTIQNYNSQDGSKSYISELPQPSPEFIDKYIKAYNEGQPITEVMVEYEAYNRSTTWEFDEPEITQLKIDKSNQITITQLKNSWSREEVEQLLRMAFFRNKGTKIDFEHWIRKIIELH